MKLFLWPNREEIILVNTRDILPINVLTFKNKMSFLSKINKCLFILILLSFSYFISSIIRSFYSVPFTESFSNKFFEFVYLLTSLPVTVCLVVSLLLVNKLKNRIYVFLVVGIPLWLFFVYISAGFVNGFYYFVNLLPYILLPFFVLIFLHYLLKILIDNVTGEKIMKFITIVLVFIFVISLSLNLSKFIKTNNIKIQKKNKLNEDLLIKKQELLRKCNDLILSNSYSDVCFMDAAWEMRDVSFCEKIITGEESRNNRLNCLKSFGQ